MRRVPYETIWADHDFQSHLFETDPDFLAHIASLIVMGRGDHTATSLPSMGRVVFYQLKRPFYDRLSKQVLTHVDVKGVGLTKSGFQAHRRHLHQPRAEFMRHEYFDYPFGPLIAEGVEDAMSVAHESVQTIKAGLNLPPTLALLRPKKVFLHGQAISPSDLNLAFGYKPRRDFAFLQVRGYSGIPARISDYLTESDGEPAIQLPSHFTPEIFIGIATGRRQFADQYLRIPISERPSRLQIFTTLTEQILQQLQIMVKKGLSPVTSKEEEGATCNHTHLQNFLFANASYVEWSPLVIHDQSPTINAHIYALIQSAYEAYLGYAAIILPNNKIKSHIVRFDEFLKLSIKFLKGPGFNRESFSRYSTSARDREQFIGIYAYDDFYTFLIQ